MEAPLYNSEIAGKSMARTNKNYRKRARVNQPTDVEDKSYLLLDIIVLILSRLPVKSLLRFKTVSQSWNSILSSSEFAKTHLQESKTSNSKTLLLWESPVACEWHQARFENREFKEKLVIESPWGKNKYQRANVICFCDDLVLVNEYEIFLMWNPSTRAYNVYRCPYDDYKYSASHGLCYNPSTRDYKIVIVFKKGYRVFSCEKGWAKIKQFSYSGISWSPGVYFNGMLYWVVIQRIHNYDFKANEMYHRGGFFEFEPIPGNNICHTNCSQFEFDATCAHEIVYFDPRDDSFKMFERPNGVEKEHIFSLTTLRGSLCLYQSSFDKTIIDLWIVHEHGGGNLWKKLMSVHNFPMPSSYTFLHPFLWQNENQLVFYVEGIEQFIVYTPRTNMFEVVQKFWPQHIFYSRLITYVESLSTSTRNPRPKRNLRKVNGG